MSPTSNNLLASGAQPVCTLIPRIAPLNALRWGQSWDLVCAQLADEIEQAPTPQVAAEKIRAAIDRLMVEDAMRARWQKAGRRLLESMGMAGTPDDIVSSAICRMNLQEPHNATAHNPV